MTAEPTRDEDLMGRKASDDDVEDSEVDLIAAMLNNYATLREVSAMNLRMEGADEDARYYREAADEARNLAMSLETRLIRHLSALEAQAQLHADLNPGIV